MCIRDSANPIFDNDGNMIRVMASVSYTHLDVYKRQVGDILCEEHLGKSAQSIEAKVAGHVRHQSKYADRSGLHDDFDDVYKRQGCTFVLSRFMIPIQSISHNPRSSGIS